MAGGQYFFGDEGRYGRGIQLYLALLHGDGTGVRTQLAQPEHPAFTWIAAGVTAVQHLVAKAGPFGDWSRGDPSILTIGFAAGVLSLFGSLNILLVHRLARATGAAEDEALWSAGLMALSNTALYYSRHLLPYDAALAAALGGLLLGLRAENPRRLLVAGFMIGFAYQIYNGYWFLVPVAATMIACRACPVLPLATRGLALCAGVAGGIGLPVAVGATAGGMEYFRIMRAFSQTATQGLFSEGWSLPWAYLAQSESCTGIAVVVLSATLICTQLWRGVLIERRVKLWLGGIAGAYALLILFSTVLEIFVVYGRTAKPFVPLLALVGGWAFSTLLAQRTAMAVLSILTLTVLAVLNFAGHLERLFPRDVEIAVLKNYGNPKHTLSVSGSLYFPLDLPVTRPDLALVNAQVLYPVRGALPCPAGNTLIEIENPLSYPPYQYESYTPAQREFIRTHDIKIRLIRLRDPNSIPNDLPAQFRYQNSEHPTGL